MNDNVLCRDEKMSLEVTSSLIDRQEKMIKELEKSDFTSLIHVEMIKLLRDTKEFIEKIEEMEVAIQNVCAPILKFSPTALY
jgi:hypothetical protein